MSCNQNTVHFKMSMYVNFVSCAHLKPVVFAHRSISPCPGWHTGQCWCDHIHNTHSSVWMAYSWPHLLTFHCCADISERYPPGERCVWGAPPKNPPGARERTPQCTGKGQKLFVFYYMYIMYNIFVIFFTSADILNVYLPAIFYGLF